MTNRQQCQSCSAPATLWICQRCSSEMRAQLQSLAYGPKNNGHNTAGLLDALVDVELKMTKLGDTGGHLKRGDERPDPFEPDTEKGRQTAQGRAATLIHMARNTLTTIMRDVCESRGVEVPMLDSTSTKVVSIWLSRNVNAIACDESAGQWRAEVDQLARSIERIIDKPLGRKYLGACPTWNEHKRSACKTELYAPADAIEKRCPTCRQTHNCNRLQLLLVNDLERSKVTAKRILELNRILPDEYRIPERTLRQWRREGENGEPAKLKIRGYQRPDGTHGITRRSEDDEPLYLWSDVRKLRSEDGRKTSTAK